MYLRTPLMTIKLIDIPVQDLIATQKSRVISGFPQKQSVRYIPRTTSGGLLDSSNKGVRNCTDT